MLHALPAAVYTCDANGCVSFYNEAAARLLGRNPLIGKDLWCGSWEIYKPDGTALPLDKCPMAVCLREGRAVYGEEIIVRTPDGSVRHVLPHPEPFLDNEGKVTGAINMLLDITEIRKSEEALKLSEQKLRDLNSDLEKKVEEKTKDVLEKNQQSKKEEERYHKMVAEVEDYAILLMDREGFIQDWNKGAEKIKGYSANEIIGQNFRLFYLPEDQKQRLLERLMTEAICKGKAVHEGWRVRKNRTKFWGSTVITALHNEAGEIIGFSKVTRDLSERKEKEEKIQRYAADLERQNKELEHFAYAASHDMKEPLRKIQFYGSTLSDNIGNILDEKNKGHLDRMIDAAKRMQKLIEDILAFSSFGSSDISFEKVSLSQVIDEVLSEYSEILEQHDVEISFSDLPIVSGIPYQLKQLFENIIANAIRYRHPARRPHISISGQTTTNLSDSLKETEHNYGYLVSIIDNGLGFETKYAETIFEIFSASSQ